MGSEGTRVLVTGGAGFIGGRLVRELVSRRCSVRVLDDLSTGSRSRLNGLAVELLQADVRNLAAVRRAVEGTEIVFHLAGRQAPERAPGSEHNPAEAADLGRAEEINVLGALNVFRAAREHAVRRLVATSSGSVYGRAKAFLLHEGVPPAPATLDAVQRFTLEHYARVLHANEDLPVVILRLFRVYGPGEPWDAPFSGLIPRLCRAAIEQTPPLLVGQGRQTRDFVFVDNVVAALCAAAWAADVAGETFNIASGQAIAVAHLWNLIAELAGAGQPQAVAAPLPVWEPAHARVSIAHANRLLGYVPAVRLHEGLRRTIDYYQQYKRRGGNAWFQPPARLVPLPPPAPVTLRRKPRAGEIELDAGDIIEVQELVADDAEVTWAPVPPPWGSRRTG